MWSHQLLRKKSQKQKKSTDDKDSENITKPSSKKTNAVRIIKLFHDNNERCCDNSKTEEMDVEHLRRTTKKGRKQSKFY